MLGPSMEMSPTIGFEQQTMHHMRLNWLGLLSSWISKAFQNTRQVMYKILTGFSSFKMFGNVGGLTEQFIETSKTSAQLAGMGYYGRAGLRVGQSFFSGVFRCMGSTAEAGTQCGASVSGQSRNSAFQQSPRHVLHGTAQGLYSGANVIAKGITGLITRPIKGAIHHGVGGAAKGFGQGVVGVVIMIPLAYIGFAERFYKGMGATFQAKGKLSVAGTRRPPRIMLSDRKRKSNRDNEKERKLAKTQEEQEQQEQQEEELSQTRDFTMKRLFDVEDAILASHVTMRIHKVSGVKPTRGSLDRAKIIVRVSLYTEQSVTETNNEMNFTNLDVFKELGFGGNESRTPTWIKLQSYTTTPGAIANRAGDIEFTRDDFTFHLDRMMPTSEDLQKFLVRGSGLHVNAIKFKIKVYEMHTMSKTLLAEKEIGMKDMLSMFPVCDPAPFKEKLDSSAAAKPNLAWSHISDVTYDKRKMTFDKLAKLKNKKSVRVNVKRGLKVRSEMWNQERDEDGERERGEKKMMTTPTKLREYNFSKDDSIRKGQTSMHRKGSARMLLNGKNATNSPRTTTIAGKKIKVPEFNENFWKRKSEDPQLTVFETPPGRYSMTSVVKKILKKTGDQAKSGTPKKNPTQKKKKDSAKKSSAKKSSAKKSETKVDEYLHTWESEDDEEYTSVWSLSESSNISADEATPNIEISGFLLRYRDHAVRMELNKIH